MNRHDAFNELKATIADQLAAAREARERARVQQMLAVLMLGFIVGVVALVTAILADPS